MAKSRAGVLLQVTGSQFKVFVEISVEVWSKGTKQLEALDGEIIIAVDGPTARRSAPVGIGVLFLFIGLYLDWFYSRMTKTSLTFYPF